MNQHAIVLIFEFAALIFAFSVHESAHAWMAARLGDPTAMMLGRITLNPLKHIDPWGSIALPILGMISGGWLIGYAKPCPITPRNFRRYKRDMVLVAVAGPVVNLLTAIVALVILLVLKHTTADAGLAVALAAQQVMLPAGAGSSILFPVVMLLYTVLLVNLSLFVFNLIPVPPLDGSRVLRLYLPYSAEKIFDRIGMYGLILVFFIVPYLTGFNPFFVVFDPVFSIFQRLLLTA